MVGHLVELSASECDALLRSHTVGRVGIVERGFPLILPVHYQMVEHPAGPRVRFRTRADNVIDHPGGPVSFQLDGVGSDRTSGWSVLIRGVLVTAAPLDIAEADSIRVLHHTESLEIVPIETTGRRLIEANGCWTFDPRGYL